MMLSADMSAILTIQSMRFIYNGIYIANGVRYISRSPVYLVVDYVLNSLENDYPRPNNSVT